MAHAATYPDVYPKAGVFTRLNAWFFATMEKIAENNPRIRRVPHAQARHVGDQVPLSRSISFRHASPSVQS